MPCGSQPPTDKGDAPCPANGGVSSLLEVPHPREHSSSITKLPCRAMDVGVLSGGVSSFPERDMDPGFHSDTSFETAVPQGYRPEDNEEEEEKKKKKEEENLEISMATLGWINEELRSNQWIKIADQPPVRVMKIVKNETEPTQAEE